MEVRSEKYCLLPKFEGLLEVSVFYKLVDMFNNMPPRGSDDTNLAKQTLGDRKCK